MPAPPGHLRQRLDALGAHGVLPEVRRRERQVRPEDRGEVLRALRMVCTCFHAPNATDVYRMCSRQLYVVTSYDTHSVML